jgi:hypothetical protein
LHELAEHRDLDQVIQSSSITRRLKICWFVVEETKAALKDRINQLEEMLVPDIPA